MISRRELEGYDSERFSMPSSGHHKLLGFGRTMWETTWETLLVWARTSSVPSLKALVLLWSLQLHPYRGDLAKKDENHRTKSMRLTLHVFLHLNALAARFRWIDRWWYA